MKRVLIILLLLLVGCSSTLSFDDTNNDIAQEDVNNIEPVVLLEEQEEFEEPTIVEAPVMDEEPIVEETPAVEDEPLVETEPVIKDDPKPKVKDKQVVPIPLVTKTVNEPPKEKEPVVTTSTVEENEEIPFTITEQPDQGVHWGISNTKQEGKPGTKTRVYEVTYVDGKETSRVLISENVTVQPQNQIIAIGQHVEDFKNCTELRKVYPGGVYSDSPVYQKKYDRDGDGHGCE